MKARELSRTALATAAARAAHLVVDQPPWILEDRLAATLLGDQAEELVAAHHDPATAAVLAVMRVAMTTRSRYAEDRLAEAVRRDVRQCVVLGAGLDSLAYRSPWTQLTFFEVDHPATQEAKRERLAAASVHVPSQVSYAAVDFTAGSLRPGLEYAGFDPTQPVYVTWLGVTQYLPTDAFGRTLQAIRGLSSETELVMEYLVPDGMRDRLGQSLADYFMPRAAASGEPWINFLTPDKVAQLCGQCGFSVQEDVGRREQVEASLWERSDALTPHEMGRLVRAVAIHER